MTFFTFGSLTAVAGEPEMLTGKITPLDLKAAPYGRWFQKNHLSYEPDAIVTEKLADLLKVGLLKDVQITIVLGTWCHDSQREVPRFYKILDAVPMDMANINLLAVNMDKNIPDHDISGLEITHTPTFIFSRGDVEINRIVETPVHSLEQDMLAILSGENYRHMKVKASK